MMINTNFDILQTYAWLLDNLCLFQQSRAKQFFTLFTALWQQNNKQGIVASFDRFEPVQFLTIWDVKG